MTPGRGLRRQTAATSAWPLCIHWGSYRSGCDRLGPIFPDGGRPYGNCIEGALEGVNVLLSGNSPSLK